MFEDRIKILVVDDEKTYIDVLVGLLSDDYKIVIAKNGRQALKKADSNPQPDLILLDIMMQGMDGFEVCRWLKENPKTRNIPVIFLSSLDEIEDKARAFEAGGIDYITKPFQGKEVIVRVKNQVQIQELRKKLEQDKTRFKILAEAAFEGIVIHKKGRIFDLNSEAIRILGSKHNNLTGQNLLKYMPKESHTAVMDEKEIPWKGEILCSPDKSIPVEIRTKNMDIQHSPVSVTAIRDLSFQIFIEKENRILQNENRVLKDSLKERYKFGDIIGRSKAMQSVYELIAKSASSDFNVVIYGESGTGKELVARTIFELSTRNNKPFVAVNCSAITETLFEREFFGHKKGSFTGANKDQPGFFDAAHQGTLFLDELGELKPSMQVKLLRVLENGEFTPVGGIKTTKTDVRIISATNKDLPSLVSKGKFREDLFYRIHVIEIILPPLRDRKEDIPLLVENFLSCFSSPGKNPHLSGKMMDALNNYQWPGNVRELQNTIQRFIATNELVLSGESSVLFEDNDTQKENQGLNRAVETLEQKMIYDCLKKTNWHRGNAAKLLEIPRRTLQRKMVKYGFRKQASKE